MTSQGAHAMPPRSNAGMWGGGIFLFPNFMMLPMWANSLSYRSRPYDNDPEWCRFEVWSLETYPVGDEPRDRPAVGRHDKKDAENWGLIPRQRGDSVTSSASSEGCTPAASTSAAPGHRVGAASSADMHEELDRYLDR